MEQRNNIPGALTCRQLQLSNTLRQLWIEHVLWTRLFIISTAFCLPDLDAVTERLLQNPADFARVLKPFYGERIAAQFERLLTDHLLIAAQLVNAAKAGNRQQVEKARMRWYANAEAIACFLANINCFWSKAEWTELLFEHLRMTGNEAIFILSRQYEKSIREYDRIEAQALAMADVMTCGIIRQFNIR